jgi:hypothetical protein
LGSNERSKASEEVSFRCFDDHRLTIGRPSTIYQTVSEGEFSEVHMVGLFGSSKPFMYLALRWQRPSNSKKYGHLAHRHTVLAPLYLGCYSTQGRLTPFLGAEFLVVVGNLSAFASADHLAAYSGLVPAANDSGKRVGNNRRMRGGNKNLKRIFYQAAFASLRSSPESRAFYDRKRAEGKRHIQALIALARRRVNVIWAMLRDGTTFEPRFAT